jgi:hypothetical protein
MSRTLQGEQMLFKRLFPIEGELVESYNRALRKVTGMETKLSAFHVDRRGKSPEIQRELGPDYLQAGHARYMIVVSPEQAGMDIIHPEFSFDETLFENLYQNHLSGISIVTRVDGLYGELEDGLRAYSADDITGIKWTKTRLHTPSGFITKARELKTLIEQLETDPSLLVKEKSAHLRKMVALAEEVGDIRGYSITNINATRDVGSFSTTLHGGMYIIRDDGNGTIKLKRPGRRATRRESAVTGRSYVISEAEVSSPGVTHIPLNDGKQVIEFLVHNHLAGIDPSLIPARLTQMEDLMLLQAQHPVARMNKYERQQALGKERMTHMHQELLDLNRAMVYGDAVDQYDLDAGVVAALLTPIEGPHAGVVSTLTTHLWPHDYTRMAKHDPSRLETIFSGADTNTQDYIIKKLKGEEYAD